MQCDDILVNKQNGLPFNYAPDDLITLPMILDKRTEKLALHVYKEFLRLQFYSQKNDINVFIDSGYRTYINQLKLYGYFLVKSGLEVTRDRVALPGHSEHQTGLAFDVGIIENGINRNITKEEAKWLAENSFKYGFILRYPEGKKDITGYGYEPWHFRYVGDDLAKYMVENNLTLEEYHSNKNKYIKRKMYPIK